MHLDAQERQFCCPACRTVAEIIHQDGLEDYYRLRETPGNRPDSAGQTTHPFDNPAFARSLVTPSASGDCAANFAVEGLHCAACAWLIESRLNHLPGVHAAQVSLNDQSLGLQWNPAKHTLGQLAQTVEALGYRLSPWHPEALLELQQRENRSSLQRLGIAGLAMMQTGMLAAALYTGGDAMEREWRELFRWVSLVFTLPVATWSAWPFYRNAINGLRQGVATMDLPVALAISGAFLASIIGTVLHTTHVYFDSVAMFTFLLLTGRHIEMRLRHRNRQQSLIRSNSLPWQAERLTRQGDSHTETVPALSLQAGDRVLVKPGAAVPVDGVIVHGQSSVSEAVLTGEPMPLHRTTGDTVLAGSINHEQALIVEAITSQPSSRVALMQQHLQQALSAKPTTVQLADRWSSVFVMVVIACAAATAAAWWNSGLDQAMAATLAVLVASCPCALSLATPTALTAATHALARRGALITRAHVLETLPHVQRAFFDKTGTLTRGEIRIQETRLAGKLDADDCLRIAASLEQHSSHPIANAFRHPHASPAHNIAQHTGLGVSGTVNGVVYRLGQATWLHAPAPDKQAHWVGLADPEQVLAWFALGDQLRDDAQPAITALQHAGISTGLLTGDRSSQGPAIARQLGMNSVQTGASPDDKQSVIAQEQARNARVMMVGDGVNDAAVLNRADVSFAMAGATPLARLQSDVLLIKDELGLIVTTYKTALRTRRIIRQNLFWAAAYNISVIPLAAMGFVPPWLAAIGMSASSLLVTCNAMRLTRMP